MIEKSEHVKVILEKELGRKLKPQEAFVLGFTYSMAFEDGRLKAFKEVRDIMKG